MPIHAESHPKNGGFLHLNTKMDSSINVTLKSNSLRGNTVIWHTDLYNNGWLDSSCCLVLNEDHISKTHSVHCWTEWVLKFAFQMGLGSHGLEDTLRTNFGGFGLGLEDAVRQARTHPLYKLLFTESLSFFEAHRATRRSCLWMIQRLATRRKTIDTAHTMNRYITIINQSCICQSLRQAFLPVSFWDGHLNSKHWPFRLVQSAVHEFYFEINAVMIIIIRKRNIGTSMAHTSLNL